MSSLGLLGPPGTSRFGSLEIILSFLGVGSLDDPTSPAPPGPVDPKNFKKRGRSEMANWGLLGPLGASWVPCGFLGPSGASWCFLGLPGASWDLLGIRQPPSTFRQPSVNLPHLPP